MIETSGEIAALVTVLSDEVYYTEGPVADHNGNIYFTTLAGGEIKKIDRKGQVGYWAKAVCPNGQCILPDGSRVVCDSTEGSLLLFDENGRYKRALMHDSFAGRIVSTPNDVVEDRSGNIYFSDSVRGDGAVYLLSKDGSQHVFLKGLDYPNGLALSNDRQHIYVAESYRNSVRCYRFTAGEPELVWSRELPANETGRQIDNLPDGLAVDSFGFIYVAHYGMGAIQRLSPDGRLCGFIRTGISFPSNLVCNGRELVVTGGHNEPGPGVVLSISPSDILL